MQCISVKVQGTKTKGVECSHYVHTVRCCPLVYVHNLNTLLMYHAVFTKYVNWKIFL